MNITEIQKTINKLKNDPEVDQLKMNKLKENLSIKIDRRQHGLTYEQCVEIANKYKISEKNKLYLACLLANKYLVDI